MLLPLKRQKLQMDLRLKFITQALLEHPTFSHLQNPERINSGDCFNWAYITHCIYGGRLCSFYNHAIAHAFILINGKYYDAEALNGVNNWKRLPYFKRNLNYILNAKPMRHEIEKFIQYWDFGNLSDLDLVLHRAKQLISDVN